MLKKQLLALMLAGMMTIGALASCGPKKEADKEVPSSSKTVSDQSEADSSEPDNTTAGNTFSKDGVSFQYPSDWSHETDSDGIDIFTPADFGQDGAISHFNIVFEGSGTAMSMSDFDGIEGEYENVIKSVMPEAYDFKYSNYSKDNKEAFVITYSTTEVEGYEIDAVATQFFVIIDGKLAGLITAMDLKDDTVGKDASIAAIDSMSLT